jgi:carbon-monoxide dehydrogenase medium subunit
MRQAETDTGRSQGTDYVFPSSIQEAILTLERHDGAARIIAGGTDVLPEIREGKLQGTARPHCLVDITRIPGLDEISITSDVIEVGAAVSFANIRDSAYINQQVHALADAARCVGAEAIQNAATWVGNLVQAMPAADGAIVALALEAEARIVDVEHATWRPVASLFRGPGLSDVDPTCQFVTHLRFPRYSGPWGTAWGRIGRRPSLVLPVLNCAVKLCLDRRGEQIKTARIALGPVAPYPYRAHGAEAYLRGQPPVKASFVQAVQLVQQEANPRDSITRASRAYRLDIIPPMIEAALEAAAQRAMELHVHRKQGA